MSEPTRFDIAGLRAVVTGAGQGIGAEIAELFARQGARVALGDVNHDNVRDLAKTLSAAKCEAIALPLDVRSKQSFVDAHAHVIERWSGVDVLVNTAALTIRKPIFELTGDEFDAVMAVNLRGVLFGCQVFGETMRSAKFGRIVNLTSVAGQTGGSPGAGAHYAASKAGIIVLTKMLAKELAKDGVTVNAVAPGPIGSPKIDAMPAEMRESILAGVPVGRFGTALEVAEIVAFLASRSMGYVTGATWDINGGMSMR